MIQRVGHLTHAGRIDGMRISLRLRNLTKQALFWSYVNVYRPLPRLYSGLRNRQRIVVLLYHRVNDDLRDSVTVGIEQFDRQMARIACNHPVVRLDDLVHGNVKPDTARSSVAVTFDDGYLDNYENAMPILLKHRIPATFFVSTGMIGSTNAFQHDLDMLGRGLPHMTWPQLRHMKELGFTIGSHTVTHLNCAESDLDHVRRELIESKDILTRKLGLTEVMFAYPYGRRSDMTPQVLELIKRLGYVACASGHGGYVLGDINRYDIPRTNINCIYSTLAFRARLEGLARRSHG